MRLLRAPTNVDMRKAARRLFTYSLSYLFVLFLGLLTDSFIARLGGFWS
jgi:protoheme IX farnesyltransferase